VESEENNCCPLQVIQRRVIGYVPCYIIGGKSWHLKVIDLRDWWEITIVEGDNH